MQGCANDYGKLIGKVAVVRMAFGCPDAVPLLTDWKKLGAMTTKGIDYSMNTTNSEADDSKGLVENLVTSMDLTISGDGEFRKNDKTTEIGAFRMSKYIFDEIQAGRQPTVWIRFDFAGEDAGTYIMGYFNTTSWSGDFGTSDISTYSGEWKVADADTVTFVVPDAGNGVTVSAPAPAPTVPGFVGNPTTYLNVTGTQKTFQILASSTGSITYTSDDPTVLTVSPSGLVTAVGVGIAHVILDDGSGQSTAANKVRFVVFANSTTKEIKFIEKSPATLALSVGDYLVVQGPAITNDGSVVSYTWKKDTAAISGATNLYYDKHNIVSADDAVYEITASASGVTAITNSTDVTVS